MAALAGAGIGEVAGGLGFVAPNAGIPPRRGEGVSAMTIGAPLMLSYLVLESPGDPLVAGSAARRPDAHRLVASITGSVCIRGAAPRPRLLRVAPPAGAPPTRAGTGEGFVDLVTARAIAMTPGVRSSRLLLVTASTRRHSSRFVW
jgi:hypothetical protein